MKASGKKPASMLTSTHKAKKKKREDPSTVYTYCFNVFVSPSAIAASREQRTHKEQEHGRNITQLGVNCCACPKSKEELKEEERERQIEIEFENYLHDHVYCKRYVCSATLWLRL